MFASRRFKAGFEHCGLKRIFSSTTASKSNLRPFSHCQQQESNSRCLSAAPSLSRCSLFLATSSPSRPAVVHLCTAGPVSPYIWLRAGLGLSGQETPVGPSKYHWPRWKVFHWFRGCCISPRLKQSHLPFKTFTWEFIGQHWPPIKTF